MKNTKKYLMGLALEDSDELPEVFIPIGKKNHVEGELPNKKASQRTAKQREEARNRKRNWEQ